MAGDKYKVKITNVGVGDPFILFKVQFQDSGTPPGGGSWTLPSETALQGLTMDIGLYDGDGGTNSDLYNPMGNISVGSIATENVYLFGLPFDQGAFSNGNTLSVHVTFSDDDGNTIYIYGDDPDDSHLEWFQVMEFIDTLEAFGPLAVYYNWADS